jgi:hypothetical protein
MSQSVKWTEKFNAIRADLLKRGKSEDDATRIASAAATAMCKSWNTTAKLTKRDDAWHYVGGWASMATDAAGNLIVDKQSDIILPADLDAAGQDALASGAHLGAMHAGRAGRIVELVTLTAEKRQAMGLPDGACGLWIGAIVEDDAVWQSVVKGDLSEFSIHGQAERETVDGAVGILTKLELDEISLVDRGAAEGATVQLFKRAACAPHKEERMTLKELISKATVSTVPDEEIQAWIDSLKDRQLMMLQALLAQAKGDENPEPKKDEPKEPEMAPEIAKRLTDAQTEIAKAQAEVAKIREEREIEKSLATADKLQHLPGTREEIAKMLRSNPEISTYLAKLEVALAKSALFQAQGSAAADADPINKITAMTQSVIKSNRAKTWDEASRIVASENPDVYAAYVAARGGK